MTTPRVINLRDTDGKLPEGAVLIDRRTKWGNPFAISTKRTRDKVIAMYREHLRKNAWLTGKAKEELKGKDLACWCAPEGCHGDVLLEVANR